MSTVLSFEDRLIIRHLRYHPSTITELEAVFGKKPQMKGRLLRIKKSGLIFSYLNTMPKVRLPKDLQPGLSKKRQVWFATPNPEFDHYSRADMAIMFQLFRDAAAKLDIDNYVEANAGLLIQLDTLLAPMYTRYIHENEFKRQKEEDETE